MMAPNLKPYQIEGVRFLREHGGGCLWDDPGLGKTRQAIVAASDHTPALVVCPSTLRAWWEHEIHTCYPNDTVYVAEEGGRVFGKQIDELPRRDWIVVHYTGLRLAQEHYSNIPWRAVIADESHYVANMRAKRTQALKYATPVDAQRIALTATPYGSLVADLWSQLAWVSFPFKLDWGYWRFYDTFVDYHLIRGSNGQRHRKPEGIRNTEQLAALMAQYGLKRTNMRELPEQDMPLLLGGRQATLYAAIKKQIEIAIRDSNTGTVTGVLIRNTLSRLLYLERCLSCPWTLDSGVKGVKLQWIEEWAIGYPKPAVIMCHFRASADGVAKVLGTTAVTGALSNDERNAIIDAWKCGEQKFLVGTIAVLGVGLSLQEGYCVLFYDSVWSFIQMTQARQRVNRINTDHPIQAIYLAVKGTVNELVLRAFRERWDEYTLVMSLIEHLSESSLTTP